MKINLVKKGLVIGVICLLMLVTTSNLVLSGVGMAGVTSGVTLSSQKQLESQELENKEKLEFVYLYVHVKEIYGTVDDPQYRPLANVTIEIKGSLFGIYWEFVWGGLTKESGKTDDVLIANGLLYKVTVSKDGYHTYRCLPSKILKTTGQWLYSVNFTMAEDGSPFVKQSSQSKQQSNSQSFQQPVSIPNSQNVMSVIPSTDSMITENHPPYVPSNYYPPCGELDIDVNVNLSWDGGDSDLGDSVTYDVYLGTHYPPPLIATVGPYSWNQTCIEYNPGTLEYSALYRMMIVAYDNHNASTEGYTCYFITKSPPEPPIIYGPTGGKIGVKYDYNFVQCNPGCYDISYFIDWGDNTTTGWTDYYKACEMITRNHTWYEERNYTIKAKVRDRYDIESHWAYFKVRMPKNQQNTQFIPNSQNVISVVSSADSTIIENHPPNQPEIKGKALPLPAILYNYTFNATDPDGDNVSYEIEWGDGTNTSWTEFYPSGEKIIRNHTFFVHKTIIIRARAKDTQGAIGKWGYLRPGPKGKQTTNPLNLQFLERFRDLIIFYMLKFQ